METGTATASGDIAASTGGATASPAVTTETSGTTQAPATQATAAPITDTTSGEPPKERWADILENTRKKEREAALAEWRQQYGWAESVQRDQLEQMAQWYGRYQGDPAEFLEAAYTEALSHPVHGATVKSRVGKLLASMRAQQATADERIEPGIPVMNERGEIVAKTYTDAQLEQLLQRKLDAALSPFKQDLDTRKSEAQKAQEKARLEAMADADIAYVSKRPFFAEHKEAILKLFKENPKLSLREAYDQVLDTTVLPSFTQKAQSQVLSDLQQKANAQTVNPGTPSGSARPKFKNFAEAHEYFQKHPEEAEAMAKR